MKRTVYQGVKFGVQDVKIDDDDGQVDGKLLQFYHEKSDEHVEFPMSDAEAKTMADLLLGKRDEESSDASQA